MQLAVLLAVVKYSIHVSVGIGENGRGNPRIGSSHLMSPKNLSRTSMVEERFFSNQGKGDLQRKVVVCCGDRPDLQLDPLPPHIITPGLA